ncbi:putative isoprenylcysteine alpha-carbonyl methylesterase ICME [Nymphon striatum]|nr:putative isoprenylcysteine alpha-carbonyl methylesterase ICME [Nymphon striatum]
MVLFTACSAPPSVDSAEGQTPLVAGVKIYKDVAYGRHQKQGMDIYAPENAENAPVVMMLHGGSWAWGDKAEAAAYVNKVNRWVPKGFIIISVDTRLLPEADVYKQIDDLAHAVAKAQELATDWGGDPSRFILMGHSSAGTLVSVLAAKPSLVTDLGGRRWLASISLDASILDAPRSLSLWPIKMFTDAYGLEADHWPAGSAIDMLTNDSIPLCLICSTQRRDNTCEQSQMYAAQAKKFNVATTIIQSNDDHGAVNTQLGLSNAYTANVEAFMATLDRDVASRLGTEI